MSHPSISMHPLLKFVTVFVLLGAFIALGTLIKMTSDKNLQSRLFQGQTIAYASGLETIIQERAKEALESPITYYAYGVIVGTKVVHSVAGPAIFAVESNGLVYPCVPTARGVITVGDSVRVLHFSYREPVATMEYSNVYLVMPLR